MPLPDVGLGCRAFRLPRQGYGWEECQDALAHDAEHGRFAIADGAAESPYSALWAQLLVEEFVHRSELLPNWTEWLPSLQERWAAAVGVRSGEGRVASGSSSGEWRVASGEKAGSSSLTTHHSPLATPHTNGAMPWYLEAGLLQGAFATFLGLVIEDQRWYAAAVGDSCLFQVRQGELIRAFPVTRAADFSNAPWLVGSRTSPLEVPHKNGLQQMGDGQPRDRIWLMTDALAQWFLLESESGGKPWLTLEPLLYAADDESAQNAFAYWIEGLRSTRQLRNDDVALLAVSL